MVGEAVVVVPPVLGVVSISVASLRLSPETEQPDPEEFAVTRRTVALAVLLLTFAAGCSGGGGTEVIGRDESTAPTDDEPRTASSSPEEGTSTTREEMDLTVESGFTSSVNQIGTRNTSAGALVTNPNENQAAYDVQVLFNLMGPDGSVLDSGSADVPYIPAGSTIATAPFLIGFDIAADPVALEVTATGDFRDDDGWDGVEFLIGAGIDLVITDGQIAPGDFGASVGVSGASLHAQVMNPSQEIAEFATWSCVFKAGGAIIGGETGSTDDRIPPGTTVALNVVLSAEVSADEVICNAYA